MPKAGMPKEIATAACKKLLRNSSSLENVMGLFLLVGSPLPATIDRSNQMGGNAHRHAEQRNDEGQREGGVQEVADILVVENGHWGSSFTGFAVIGGRLIDRM